MLSIFILITQLTWAAPKDCAKYLYDFSGSIRHPIRENLAPKTVEELRAIVISSDVPVSIRGGGFSQGGQVIAHRGLVIDMHKLNRVIEYSPEQRTIRVQTGSTWAAVQRLIDEDNLSVKVMQSYNNFQVGGALGVNAHGRYVNYGPIISTVESIRVMLADGRIVHADRVDNSDLFYGAIGGYGALGIIVDATFALTDNEKLERVVTEFNGQNITQSVEDYIRHFDSEIMNGDSVMTNADIYPPKYQNIRSVTFRRTDEPLTVQDRLQPEYTPNLVNALKAIAVSAVHLFKWTKISRDKAAPQELAKKRVVWRNYEASYDLNELSGANDYAPWTKDVLPIANQEAILQEYFIPRSQVAVFVSKMKEIFLKHKVNVLNVSIRHVPKNDEAILSWSKEESFALVIYYSQYFGFDPKPEMEKAQRWTREMLDEVLAVAGSFYLPYQIYARGDQFRTAYPKSDVFAGLKIKYDPERKFSNLLLDRYLP